MYILFQGDSITDSNRNRNNADEKLGLGSGYVSIIGSKLMSEHPNVKVVNRGISGNRIADMYSRWIEDALNLPFDIISILNGVNDIGFQLRLRCGADKNKFRFIYDRILFETLEKRPNSIIALGEPFLFKVDTGENNDIYTDWDRWNNEVEERGVVVKELAQKYNCIFVPYRQAFLEVEKLAHPAHWSSDGIHPTHAGHGIIAKTWLETLMPNINSML